MCKLGDIIIVKNYLGDDGEVVKQHSFIVIDDKSGFIEGLRYDIVTNVMSSFKSEEQKGKKLKFKENVEFSSESIVSKTPHNNKSGFIKADQLIYFDKSNLDYFVFGHVSKDLINDLAKIIVILREKGTLKNNIKNLKKESQNQKQDKKP